MTLLRRDHRNLELWGSIPFLNHYLLSARVVLAQVSELTSRRVLLVSTQVVEEQELRNIWVAARVLSTLNPIV
jgi:hypothetical protein